MGPLTNKVVCMCCMLNRVQLFVIPWTVACQTPLSVEFSRQYWSGLLFPIPGDIPDPGSNLYLLPLIEPTSLASPALAARFITTA